MAWTLAHLQPDADEQARADARGRGRRMAAELTVLAMDGKCARGARRADGSRPMFMAAATHHRPMVVAHRQIPDKTSEICCVATLLADLRALGWDLAATVITLDALHTVRDTAAQILAAGAHYLMIVKRNRAELYARCAELIAAADPADLDRHTGTDRGHGRTEERILTARIITDTDEIDFPSAAQIIRIVRYTGGLDGQRTTKEVVYAITGLTRDQADAPALSTLARGHWQIEAIHHIRDVTLREDASHARTRTLPTTLAVIRNTIIAALPLAGATNIAKARRWAASAAADRVIDLFTANANLDITPL